MGTCNIQTRENSQVRTICAVLLQPSSDNIGGWGIDGPSQTCKNIPAALAETFRNLVEKFPLTPMGVLAHRLLTRSLVPPMSMSGNFQAHMSAESPSNISPNPEEVISEVSEP